MKTTFKISEDKKQYRIRVGNAIIQSDYINERSMRIILNSFPEKIAEIATKELVYDMDVEFPSEIKVAELYDDILCVTTYHEYLGIYTYWPRKEEGVDQEPWFLDTDNIVAEIEGTYYTLDALEYCHNKDSVYILYSPTESEQGAMSRLLEYTI